MKKKIIIWSAALALVAGALFFFFGRQGVFYPWSELQRKNDEIAAKTRQIDSLRREIDLLTNDTAYIERIAREKLGMARQNENVYKFIEKGK
jgi:cell division protein FtsB